MNPCVYSSAIAACVFVPSAFGQVHDGDIVVRIVQGHLAAGQETDNGGVDYRFPVFASVFGTDFPDFTNEPGLDSGEGQLPPGSGVGFTIRGALRVWDGEEFPAGPEGIPPERIEVRLGPLGPVVTPLEDVPIEGFEMVVSALGELHQHPGYTLGAPASEGLYLYECELWSDRPEIGRSRPLWIVFRQGSSEGEQDRAIDWVRTHLVCAADFNADRQADFFDYLDFVRALAGEEPGADFNGDAQIDFFDYLDFAEAFSAGCE